jgi:hypothetical protein
LCDVGEAAGIGTTITPAGIPAKGAQKRIVQPERMHQISILAAALS